ncbi:MAG: photosynthetic complex putative assembly protein PuhB [Pseudomonadota bacterium]
MDLNKASSPNHQLAGNLPAHGAGEVPEGLSDIILRRGKNEKILWRGKPQFLGLAATAFHTNSVALYFALLTVISGVSYGLGSGLTLAVMGVAALLILHGLAYLYARKSHYVLTNERLLILTGLTVEKRISVPLSQIGAAHLKMQKGDVGTIAMEISGDRQIGYLVLWPHARPLRFNRPQPLIRVVEDAPEVSKLLTKAVSERAEAVHNLMEINAPADMIDNAVHSELRGAATA